jgi:DNA-binding NarL/FixJ family response regulator
MSRKSYDTASRRGEWKPRPLTERQRALLGALAEGLHLRETAAKIGITQGTAKVYVFRLHERYGTHNIVSLLLATGYLIRPEQETKEVTDGI